MPVRKVIPLPQVVHVASRIGPVTTRGGVTFVFLTFGMDWAASNSSRSMIAGTATITCSETGFDLSLRESRRLNVNSIDISAIGQNAVQCADAKLNPTWVTNSFVRHSQAIRFLTGRLPHDELHGWPWLELKD